MGETSNMPERTSQTANRPGGNRQSGRNSPKLSLPVSRLRHVLKRIIMKNSKVFINVSSYNLFTTFVTMACVGACRRDRDVHRDDAGDQCCGSVDRHAADEALRH